jgi:hypothetical protein
VLAVVLVWVLAVVVTLILLGFCVYEVNWKARRLLADANRLGRTVEELTAVQGRLSAIQHRIAGRNAGASN